MKTGLYFAAILGLAFGQLCCGQKEKRAPSKPPAKPNTERSGVIYYDTYLPAYRPPTNEREAIDLAAMMRQRLALRDGDIEALDGLLSALRFLNRNSEIPAVAEQLEAVFREQCSSPSMGIEHLGRRMYYGQRLYVYWDCAGNEDRASDLHVLATAVADKYYSIVAKGNPLLNQPSTRSPDDMARIDGYDSYSHMVAVWDERVKDNPRNVKVLLGYIQRLNFQRDRSVIDEHAKRLLSIVHEESATDNAHKATEAASALLGLAVVYVNRGEKETARRYYEAARPYFEKDPWAAEFAQAVLGMLDGKQEK